MVYSPDIFTSFPSAPITTFFWRASRSLAFCKCISSSDKVFTLTASSFLLDSLEELDKRLIEIANSHSFNGNRGDLLAEVKIMVPTELNDNEKELFEKMAEISTFNPRNV